MGQLNNIQALIQIMAWHRRIHVSLGINELMQSWSPTLVWCATIFPRLIIPTNKMQFIKKFLSHVFILWPCDLAGVDGGQAVQCLALIYLVMRHIMATKYLANTQLVSKQTFIFDNLMVVMVVMTVCLRIKQHQSITKHNILPNMRFNASNRNNIWVMESMEA